VIVLEKFRGEREEDLRVFFQIDDHSTTSEEDIVLLVNL
jgi:hypothetical protein